MIKKGTLIALIFFGLFVVGYFVLEHYGWTGFLTKNNPAPIAESNWITFENEVINSVSYEERTGNADDFIRTTENLWQQEDSGLEIDPGLIERFLTELVSTSPLNVLHQIPDPSASGFEPPQLLISITKTDGNVIKIRFGDINPIQTGYYAQIGSGEVVIISKGTVQNLQTIIGEIISSLEKPGSN